MCVDISKVQDDVVGDGTTSVVLAAELVMSLTSMYTLFPLRHKRFHGN